MSHTKTDIPALTKLEQALASDALPIHARKAGQRLLERLKSPVNCVVLGLQDSGKSTLLNFMLGETFVPEGARFPRLELAWADTSRTIFTKTDGTTTVQMGVVPAASSINAFASVKIEIDLPILKRLTLFEVALNGSAADQAEAVDWAVSRAEIVLWCTQEFLQQEQDLWAGVPEALKDHGFLVLTKADALAAQGVLTERIQSVQDVAADEFHSVFPIATFQAIDAAKMGIEAGSPALKASGGSALMAAVLRLAGQGRNADMDSALVFLDRHGRKARAKQDGATAALHNGLAKVTTEDVADRAVEANAAAAEDFASTALNYLMGRATELVRISADPSQINPAIVLNYCGETANGLAELVTEQDAEDPLVAALHEDLLDAAELLLLMEMETGVSPAADAVTVLLQVRRSLEYRLAA